MPNVYKWPPVALVGHEYTHTRPGTVSLGLSGAAYYAQAAPTRRAVTAIVPGIGRSLVDAGYIEQLKRLHDGRLPLVRFTPLSHHWILASDYLAGSRGETPLGWSADGASLNWSADAAVLDWTAGDPITATAGGSAGGWFYLDCDGFRAQAMVAAPGERVRVDVPAAPGDGGVSELVAHVLRPSWSDAAGVARIWVDASLIGGVGGAVLIGAHASMAMRIRDWPRAVQNLRGDFSYTFDMIEAFASDYAEGFVELDPWS